jgi:zinc transport system substrate-binding protein
MFKKLFLICVAPFFLYGCQNNNDASVNLSGEQKIKIVASGYVPYTIAKSILGDSAEINMLTLPGAQAHSFEPSPKNALQIKNADFFFFISGKTEPWAMSVSEGKGIELAYDLPDNNAKDPHYWMSFENMSAMAANMAEHIIENHPKFESKILQNTADFNRELQMLARLYGQLLTKCGTRNIYHIGHMAFGYIARKYELNFKPLSGALSDSEPSAGEMAKMIREIKNNKADYIFTEETVNPKISAVIAAESGARILNLYTIEDITKEEFENGITYKQFMMMNLENLTKGLDCN